EVPHLADADQPRATLPRRVVVLARVLAMTPLVPELLKVRLQFEDVVEFRLRVELLGLATLTLLLALIREGEVFAEEFDGGLHHASTLREERAASDGLRRSPRTACAKLRSLVQD